MTAAKKEHHWRVFTYYIAFDDGPIVDFKYYAGDGLYDAEPYRGLLFDSPEEAERLCNELKEKGE